MALLSARIVRSRSGTLGSTRACSNSSHQPEDDDALGRCARRVGRRSLPRISAKNLTRRLAEQQRSSADQPVGRKRPLAFAAMRRLARAFYRLVGLAVTLFGAWVLLINLVDVSYSGWILAWILSAGLLGAVGGVIFLLSFDGPARLRTRQVRLLGWLGMVFSALMPWSFQFVMLPLVLLTLPALSSPRLSGSTAPNTQ